MCIKYHNNSPARSNKLQELQEATQADDELALLKQTIMSGWPSTIKEIPPVLQPYWTFCEELTIEDGLILKGTRIVIPSKEQEAILNQIHDSHLGLKKGKLQAKQMVYWPGSNDQLENFVLNCQLCLKYSNSKKKQGTNLSLGHDIPLFPWTKVATDSIYYLLITQVIFLLYSS